MAKRKTKKKPAAMPIPVLTPVEAFLSMVVPKPAKGDAEPVSIFWTILVEAFRSMLNNMECGTSTKQIVRGMKHPGLQSRVMFAEELADGIGDTGIGMSRKAIRREARRLRGRAIRAAREKPAKAEAAVKELLAW